LAATTGSRNSARVVVFSAAASTEEENGEHERCRRIHERERIVRSPLAMSANTLRVNAIALVLLLVPGRVVADRYPGPERQMFVGTIAVEHAWTRPAALGADLTFAYEHYYGDSELFLFAAGYRLDLGLDAARGEPHLGIDGIASLGGVITARVGVGARLGPFWPYSGVVHYGGVDVRGAIDVNIRLGVEDVDDHPLLRFTGQAGAVIDGEHGEVIGYVEFGLGLAWSQPIGPR
jgi:hypothetical protein